MYRVINSKVNEYIREFEFIWFITEYSFEYDPCPNNIIQYSDNRIKDSLYT